MDKLMLYALLSLTDESIEHNVDLLPCPVNIRNIFGRLFQFIGVYQGLDYHTLAFGSSCSAPFPQVHSVFPFHSFQPNS